MIKLYAEQLFTQLDNILYKCYLLYGNEPLLIQESQDCIKNWARAKKFNEHFSIILDIATDWDMILNLCQVRSLFSQGKILSLIFPDDSISDTISKKMLQLIPLLHENLLLILRINKLTRHFKKSIWFNMFSKNAVLVNCTTPNLIQLPSWIARRALSKKLRLDDAACQLLCYYYEGNLLALNQRLEQLSLIYPDGNLTLARIETEVNDTSRFTSLHWVDSILTGKSKRSVHILHQLQLEDVEPIILLRCIQNEVLLLLKLKHQFQIPLPILYKHYKIWQNRQPLIAQALKRLTMLQLCNAVKIMTKIEITLKQNHRSAVWVHLNVLGLLLCNNIPLLVQY